MTPLRPTNFRLEDELLRGLQAVKERDGIGISEQVRRAVQDWLAKKGVKVKAVSRRAVMRRYGQSK
jgi:hypothetical protein